MIDVQKKLFSGQGTHHLLETSAGTRTCARNLYMQLVALYPLFDVPRRREVLEFARTNLREQQENTMVSESY